MSDFPGKTSKRRPMFISIKEWDDRHDKYFREKEKKTRKEKSKKRLTKLDK